MKNIRNNRLDQSPLAYVVYIAFALMAVGLLFFYGYFLVVSLLSIFGSKVFENTIILAITTASTSVQVFLITKSYQFFTGKNNQFTEGAGFAWSLTLLIGGSIANALFYVFTCAQFVSFH